ncbi:MAG: hypothetical protein KDD62_07185, partial [Bdellovibrionales bacterium]|nr:hypothetical protein [Bdellovibrionales bacterium]
STILAANFFSKRESNLISPEPLELDLAAQANQRESSTNDSLAGLFAWTILGFLVLESLVRSLRTHRLRRA